MSMMWRAMILAYNAIHVIGRLELKRSGQQLRVDDVAVIICQALP